MWLKEVIEQLKVYCGLRSVLDANVALSHLLNALTEIEELQDEIERLREGVECHVARPGEGTYECDIKNPCPACRLRVLEKLEWDRRKIKENADIERNENEEMIKASISKSLKSLR